MKKLWLTSAPRIVSELTPVPETASAVLAMIAPFTPMKPVWVLVRTCGVVVDPVMVKLVIIVS